MSSLTLWSGLYIISRPHQVVDGVRLYLGPTGSLGFLKLVMEQWQRLQRNTNGTVCNLSFSAWSQWTEGSYWRPSSAHTYTHSPGTMGTPLCYSHYKSCLPIRLTSQLSLKWCTFLCLFLSSHMGWFRSDITGGHKGLSRELWLLCSGHGLFEILHSRLKIQLQTPTLCNCAPIVDLEIQINIHRF